ncbi:MAG: helix-turn-helix transcriptional regulator [Clostridiales bacterium]|nr:helix-turn-helix transcriptional regulator [Clostridiales bacterium]MBR2617517.1 helix-turn-helix transcriptional regulator [Clostridia bacterium]
MKFTERFNEVLHITNKTQAEIARALHLCKQTVSDYKRGKAVPSLQMLCALCDYLDVSADYLLGRTEY